MMTLLMGGLAALASSLVIRALLGAGLSIASYVWVGSAIETLLGNVAAAWGGMPAAVVQLIALGGAGQALSIVGAALLARAAIVAAQTAIKVTTA